MQVMDQRQKPDGFAPRHPRISDLQSALILPISALESLVTPHNGINPLKREMEIYRRSISQMTNIENFHAWALESFLNMLAETWPALSRPVMLAVRELQKWKTTPCKGEWETSRVSSVHKVLGLDGIFAGLSSWEDLHTIPLHHGDLIVGMEHGPTVTLPLAAALRQKLFRPGGVLAHIDAHEDNVEKDTPASLTPDGFRRSRHWCSAGQTHARMESYLSATDDEAAVAFGDLVGEVRNDIATFLRAVAPYIGSMGAAIRRRHQKPSGATLYPFSEPLDYLDAVLQPRRPKNLPEWLLSTDPAKDIIFSLDGDVLGVRKEDLFWQNSRYQKRLDWLFSTLEAHARWYASQPDHGSILYTLSVDPDWVSQPARVFADFVQFYTTSLNKALRPK